MHQHIMSISIISLYINTVIWHCINQVLLVHITIPHGDSVLEHALTRRTGGTHPLR
jgi:hypothetical protein